MVAEMKKVNKLDIDNMRRRARMLGLNYKEVGNILILDKQSGERQVYTPNGKLETDLYADSVEIMGNYIVVQGRSEVSGNKYNQTLYNVFDQRDNKRLFKRAKILNVATGAKSGDKQVVLFIKCVQMNCLLNPDGETLRLSKNLYQLVFPRVQDEKDARGIDLVFLRVGLFEGSIGQVQLDFKNHSLPEYMIYKQ